MDFMPFRKRLAKALIHNEHVPPNITVHQLGVKGETTTKLLPRRHTQKNLLKGDGKNPRKSGTNSTLAKVQIARK